MPKTLTTTLAALATLFLLAGCGSGPSETTPGTQSTDGQILSGLGLDDLGTREVVETLDAMPKADRPEGLTTSIDATRLTLSDDGGSTEELPLPEDLMYVSAAPYLTETHDCYLHSPTGCVGELQNTEVDVTVTDTATGKTVLDETRRTFDNGFVGLWLPRNIETEITVTHKGRTATTSLSTAGDDAQTCVTTLPLT